MKKVLLRVGIICGALVLIAAAVLFVKYRNLRSEKNYAPVSVADFVRNAFPSQPNLAITKYVRTVSEEPLADGLTLRKSEVIVDHRQCTVYYIGIDSFWGRYYQCVETDYSGMHSSSTYTIQDTDGNPLAFSCRIVQCPENTVVCFASRYLLSDSYRGAPAAYCEVDENYYSGSFAEGPLQFFVLPPLDETPEDYTVECEYFYVTKQDIQNWLSNKTPAFFLTWKTPEDS